MKSLPLYYNVECKYLLHETHCIYNSVNDYLSSQSYSESYFQLFVLCAGTIFVNKSYIYIYIYINYVISYKII